MADNSEFDVILHGCNCFCVMGAGIALGVKNKFPEVYKADKATLTGDIDKLGKHSFVTVKNNKGDDLTVFNCYSQYHYKFTNKKAPVDYDAIKKSLTLMVAEIKLNTNKVFQIGLPLMKIQYPPDHGSHRSISLFRNLANGSETYLTLGRIPSNFFGCPYRSRSHWSSPVILAISSLLAIFQSSSSEGS